jgi:hypothetical protein
VNVILDDILTNTFSFVQLKPDLSNWRNKDELFDLGIINWERPSTDHSKIERKVVSDVFNSRKLMES